MHREGSHPVTWVLIRSPCIEYIIFFTEFSMDAFDPHCLSSAIILFKVKETSEFIFFRSV